jgi:assimilatory nitrate reductase catalytic subunit
MTRTGKSPRLSAHVMEPYLEVHPSDARTYDLDEGALVRVESPWGSATLRARVVVTQRRGSVFAPMHWSGENSSDARIDAVVNPSIDPLSGQPELKHTPVRLVPVRPAWEGFLLLRNAEPIHPRASYWVRAVGDGHVAYALAADVTPPDWSSFARGLLSARPEHDLLEMHDRARGRYRAARIDGDALAGCFFVGGDHDRAMRDWVGAIFRIDGRLGPEARTAILAGRPGRGHVSTGPIVCACKGVGTETIRRAIHEGKLRTTLDVARATEAGTGCGSCLPEVRALLAEMFEAEEHEGFPSA